DLDIASEFRYREPPLDRDGVTLVISQSGETLDTLAALRYARGQGQKILAILNAPESTMARESDGLLPTLAGPEIGVASTKAFTTQLVVLACLAIAAARARGLPDDAVPVIVAAPSGPLFEKTASNIQEVVARGGRVVLLADREGIRRIGDKVWAAIELPRVDPFVAPILYAVPVQLLAYHVAVVKG